MYLSKFAIALFILTFLLCGTADMVFGEQGVKKTVTVTSQTMEADRTTKEVVFKGNVVAEEEFTLCSDELYVRYDEKREIKDMRANGNVRIIQNDKRAIGREAVYDREKRVVIITGDAFAVQCSDKVKGDKITFYLDSNNIMVEGGKDGRVNAVILPKKECGESSISEEFRCQGTR